MSSKVNPSMIFSKKEKKRAIQKRENKEKKNAAINEIADVVAKDNFDITINKSLASIKAATRFVNNRNKDLDADDPKWEVKMEDRRGKGVANDIVVYTPAGAEFSVNGYMIKKSENDYRRNFYEAYPNPQERKKFIASGRHQVGKTAVVDVNGNKVTIPVMGSGNSYSAIKRSAKHEANNAKRVKAGKAAIVYDENGKIPIYHQNAFNQFRLKIVSPIIAEEADDLKTREINRAVYTTKTAANMWNDYILPEIFTGLGGDNNKAYNNDFYNDDLCLKKTYARDIMDYVQQMIAEPSGFRQEVGKYVPDDENEEAQA